MTDQKTPGLTVGELRQALAGVPDETEIVIRFFPNEDGGGEDVCGGILTASVEHAHDEDDTPFFAIDCTDDPDRFEEA